MKIIKRNGSEEDFNIEKIINAVRKANNSSDSPFLTEEQILDISDYVEYKCNKIKRAVSVEEIQDMVEDQLMAKGAFELARRYVRYRYNRSLVRKANTTDNRILSLIECNNEEVKQENSNKNPTVNSVQRDYMAGEVSRDLTRRMLLSPDIVEADKQGIIHFHDSDYFAQHMHNCDLVNLEDMLQNGTVISDTLIEKPHSFSAPQLFNCLQHRNSDYCAGCQQPVRRPEHQPYPPCSVCSDFKGENPPRNPRRD